MYRRGDGASLTAERTPIISGENPGTVILLEVTVLSLLSAFSSPDPVDLESHWEAEDESADEDWNEDLDEDLDDDEEWNEDLDDDADWADDLDDAGDEYEDDGVEDELD